MNEINNEFEMFRPDYISVRNLGTKIDIRQARKNINEEKCKLLDSGAKNWNKWAMKFSNYMTELNQPASCYVIEINKEVKSKKRNYNGYIFPVKAIFKELTGYESFSMAKFQQGVEFHGALDGYIWFSETKFDANANFTNATINGTVNFSGATFNCVADFSNMQINEIILEDTKFSNNIPNFRNSLIANKVNFLNTQIPSKGNISNDTVLKYRKLKELAIESNNYDQELKFSASEYRTTRKLKLRFKSICEKIKTESSSKLFLDWLYDFSSDYGRSIKRPALCFVTLFIFCFIVNYIYGCLNPTDCEYPLTQTYATFQFSFKNSLPMLPLTDPEAEAFHTCLFDSISPPQLIKLMSNFQLIVSTIFLFLIGLGLRNRFKIN